MYTYAGRADGMGPLAAAEFSVGLPGGLPSDHMAGVLLLATAPATVVTLGAFCGVTLSVS
jgi:hypothetical protein